MTGCILKRLVPAIPVLFGVSILVFAIMAMIPGDPAIPENVEKLNRDLGLDQGLVARYFIWLGTMLQGGSGRSFARNRPVLDRLGATLLLAGTAFALCAIVGIAAGVVSAARQYGVADKPITFVVLPGIPSPSSFPGMMTILVLAVQLRLFPVSEMWPVRGDRTFPALLDPRIKT